MDWKPINCQTIICRWKRCKMSFWAWGKNFQEIYDKVKEDKQFKIEERVVKDQEEIKINRRIRWFTPLLSVTLRTINLIIALIIIFKNYFFYVKKKRKIFR